MTWNELPHEIVEMVLDEMLDDESAMVHDLVSCLTVCRQWYPVVLRVLYACVPVIATRQYDYQAHLYTLKRHASKSGPLGAHVRHLRFDSHIGTVRQLEQLYEACPNLDTLDYVFFLGPPELTDSDSISTIRRFIEMPVMPVLKRTVTSLRLVCAWRNVARTYPVATGPLLRQGQCGHLTKLCLDGLPGTRWSTAFVDVIHLACPLLTTLEIETGLKPCGLRVKSSNDENDLLRCVTGMRDQEDDFRIRYADLRKPTRLTHFRLKGTEEMLNYVFDHWLEYIALRYPELQELFICSKDTILYESGALNSTTISAHWEQRRQGMRSVSSKCKKLERVTLASIYIPMRHVAELFRNQLNLKSVTLDTFYNMGAIYDAYVRTDLDDDDFDYLLTAMSNRDIETFELKCNSIPVLDFGLHLNVAKHLTTLRLHRVGGKPWRMARYSIPPITYDSINLGTLLVESCPNLRSLTLVRFDVKIVNPVPSNSGYKSQLQELELCSVRICSGIFSPFVNRCMPELTILHLHDMRYLASADGSPNGLFQLDLSNHDMEAVHVCFKGHNKGRGRQKPTAKTSRPATEPFYDVYSVQLGKKSKTFRVRYTNRDHPVTPIVKPCFDTRYIVHSRFHPWLTEQLSDEQSRKLWEIIGTIKETRNSAGKTTTPPSSDQPRNATASSSHKQPHQKDPAYRYKGKGKRKQNEKEHDCESSQMVSSCVKAVEWNRGWVDIKIKSVRSLSVNGKKVIVDPEREQPLGTVKKRRRPVNYGLNSNTCIVM